VVVGGSQQFDAIELNDSFQLYEAFRVHETLKECVLREIGITEVVLAGEDVG